jgi:hypothetical protein
MGVLLFCLVRNVLFRGVKRYLRTLSEISPVFWLKRRKKD